VWIDPLRHPLAAGKQLTETIQMQAAGAEAKRRAAQQPERPLSAEEVAEANRQAEERERAKREEAARQGDVKARLRVELLARLLAVEDPVLRLVLAAHHWAEDQGSVASMFTEMGCGAGSPRL
jgi:hypothetical protein